jgi:hypothetical protein
MVHVPPRMCVCICVRGGGREIKRAKQSKTDEQTNKKSHEAGM